MPSTLDYKIGAAPSVNTWLPGETLFSLASRQHMLSGHARCADTCLSWFGHPRIGSAHDFPARIDVFTERTCGRFGLASSVIYEHTILPYYLPFRSARERANAVAAMAGNSVGPLKAQLGILATKFGAAHPLKACPKCIRSDAAKHHVAYWHVEHQLPGVWICPWHHELLELANVKWMGINRFGWCLPADPDMSLSRSVDGSRRPSLEILQRVAQASIQLWSLPESFQFSSDRLLEVFHQEMIGKDLGTKSGRINAKRFGEAVFGVTIALDGIREFATLHQSPEQAASMFSRQLSQLRSAPHPLRQIILILSLFGDWNSFFKRYNEMPSYAPPPARGGDDEHKSIGTVGRVGAAEKQTKFLNNLRSCNGSIHAAAERTGISVATGMAWAAAANIEVKRRGKILTPERRALLIQALRRGIDKADAASAFGVSVQTITTTLRTEVGLHDRWSRARLKRAREQAREAWKKTASELSAPTPKALRSIQPAAYAWLYRHDRTWLKSFSKHIFREPKGNHSATNWELRDSLLAKQVQEAALMWREQHRKGYLTNAMLCRLVPELKSRLSQIQQLPRTKATLVHVPRRTYR